MGAMVISVRRDPDRRQDGEDEGTGVVARAYGDTAGVDAGGIEGDRSAHGWAVVVVGTAGECGTEQCCAEQRGEALHGQAPCGWKAGRRNILPSFT